MSEAFVWKDEYRIGVDEIDSQHQNLFRIANRLQDDMSSEQLQSELMGLYRHVREHFGAEEKLMRDSDYPGYLEHRQQHDALLNHLNALAADVAREPEKLPALKSFLADWIVKHVLQHDQALATHLQ